MICIIILQNNVLPKENFSWYLLQLLYDTFLEENEPFFYHFSPKIKNVRMCLYRSVWAFLQVEHLSRRARTSVVEAHWGTSSKKKHKNVRICTYTSVWMVVRKHPSGGPPIDKDSAHHAHPLRTALSSRLRGAVVTALALHSWGPGSNPMAGTFSIFQNWGEGWGWRVFAKVRRPHHRVLVLPM